MIMFLILFRGFSYIEMSSESNYLKHIMKSNISTIFKYPDVL